jgi:VIT1/CCC1 family predicted Fe2+/Mn2+ transporter
LVAKGRGAGGSGRDRPADRQLEGAVMSNSRPSLGQVVDSWRQERESAYLYAVMAQVEPDARLSEMEARLASRALVQAGLWSKEAERLGGAPPEFAPSLRSRLVAGLVRRLGVRRMMPVLSAVKVRGLSAYRLPTPPGHPWPTAAPAEAGRHRGVGSGGNLRAAVFGVNDGLVSNASLIFGVAGAAMEPRAIVLTGVAGLLAGALSMAAGEFVSVTSQREFYERQIGLEREELALYPAEEAEELALVYAARGVPLDEARHLASQLFADPASALDTLAREELGLNPDDLGSPWGAARSSFLSFVAGAIVPLAPFIALSGQRATGVSAVASALGLFGVGAAMSLFTGRPPIRSGLRMVAIGGAAVAATYAIGALVGVRLG